MLHIIYFCIFRVIYSEYLVGRLTKNHTYRKPRQKWCDLTIHLCGKVCDKFNSKSRF